MGLTTYRIILDMDDLLERPTYYAAPVAAVENPEDAEQSSDDEDGGPDWTKLP